MASAVLPVNRCDHPPWVIASPRFNRHPLPIEIQGVRRAHRSLFSRLADLADPDERARCFRDYMRVVFRVGAWHKEASRLGRRALRNSYLRVLRGWMLDSSSPEGAVLKGWVESRFGIPPTFHAGPIDGVATGRYFLYLAEWMRGSARSNAVESQLDVLYEFVQDELGRRGDGGPLTLYRGVRDFAEHRVLEELGENRYVVRLNNLSSFSSRLEHAWEFGSRVLVAEVPQGKVFFRSDLLPGILPRREEETLVIGGDYEVAVRSY
ncbi:MAG: N-acyl homoserine lactonase [Deltaproteobacteria bacterium]|nr:N-acyl homoserine lactonase [Deltaproteobacteria bacterium]